MRSTDLLTLPPRSEQEIVDSLATTLPADGIVSVEVSIIPFSAVRTVSIPGRLALVQVKPGSSKLATYKPKSVSPTFQDKTPSEGE